MSIWIVTTGNSDVQLNTNERWEDFYEEVRYSTDIQYGDKFLDIKRDELTKRFPVPARVIGLVYGNHLNDAYDDLAFPLLDTCYKYFAENPKELPSKVILLLTDQRNVFNNEDLDDEKIPYWQDTCTLESIFKKYLFEKFKIEPLVITLKPESENGLDKWNDTLKLVEQKLEEVKQELNAVFEENRETTVYVSHQAGTPAISSAVQFVSLSQFNNVKFLSSNIYYQDYEQKSQPELIDVSYYWRGMQIQKAKALLKNFDYSGIKDLFSSLWKNPEDALNSQEQKLLNMAIQWNCAKFQDFGQARGEAAKERIQQWWWTGYEEAYLAVVRLEQGNTVEALFHSFRALEGLTYEWVRTNFPQYIKNNKYNVPIFNKPDILNGKKFRLYGKDLYELLIEIKKSCSHFQQESHIYVWENLAHERNKLFHKLLGMEKKEVFKAWDTNNNSEWQNRVLGCLNSVSDKEFKSLEEASLMFEVHQELKAAINNYELKNS
ncbi:MAG: hypothetical protein HEQ19_28010 [Gloeotrichia echinulata CP02]|jgi:hypothetical protein